MDLNDDVVIEILLHLPVKSVIRFKSVCKSWCSIIESFAFKKIHFHNHHSKNNNIEDDDTLYLQFRDTTWTLSSLLSFPNNWKSYNDFPPAFHKFLNDNITTGGGRWVDDSIIFYGPVNGLICIYNPKPTVKDDVLEWSLSIAICNPCLGEMKFLPSSPVCLSLLDSLVGSETWDQAFTGRNIGFGFDFLTKDYKVVQLIWSLDGRTYVEVYSARTNTWRELVVDIFGDVGDSYNEIFAIKSTCKGSGTRAYWQLLKLTGNGDYMEILILSFDMQNEVFEKLRLPEFYYPGVIGLEHTTVFARDDESLVLFVNKWYYCRLEMWEMDKERGWTHVRNLYDDPLLEHVDIWPIALWKDGVVLRCDFPQDKNLFSYWFMYDDEEKKYFELPKDRLEILEYKCTLYSLFGDMHLTEN